MDDKLNLLFGLVCDERKLFLCCKFKFRDLDEKELFMELIRDIVNELDINMLSYKIFVNVSIFINLDCCLFFFVCGLCENKVLVFKLFDVIFELMFDELIRLEEDEICVFLGVGIVGYIVVMGEIINIKDVYLVSL